ncbi:MAG TPA: putative 2OG-Fe(II) oxygenase [Casimicrobiaceae bacterium]|nr:putative 2OG-Fe(II) oxygenase [Casimicrobiaceae bacterium]
MTAELMVAAGDQAALPESIKVNGVDLPVWPQGQPAAHNPASLLAITTFPDVAVYHPELIATAMAAEQDPRFRAPMLRGGCGVKVRNIPAWNTPAATLIHARALMVAHYTLSRRAVFADDTWASVYRAGDYCIAHSHLRSYVSIVYMLDPGDEDPDDKLAGKLWLADPRIPWCCPHEPGRVTRPVIPTMTSGTMLIFSSDYLHSVNPYYGLRPRVTLSWNITLERLPGRPREGWE